MRKVSALVFGGGEIHDWEGIQPVLVAALKLLTPSTWTPHRKTSARWKGSTLTTR